MAKCERESWSWGCRQGTRPGRGQAGTESRQGGEGVTPQRPGPGAAEAPLEPGGPGSGCRDVTQVKGGLERWGGRASSVSEGLGTQWAPKPAGDVGEPCGPTERLSLIDHMGQRCLGWWS